MKQYNEFLSAQELCADLFSYVTPEFRSGFGHRIHGGVIQDLRRDMDEYSGFMYAEQMIADGRIFYVQPFKCERDSKCPTRFQYGGYWACNTCNTHIDTPEWWKVKVMKDGNAYCCVGNGFSNLQESDNYAFGTTRDEAIENYRSLIYASETGGVKEEKP